MKKSVFIILTIVVMGSGFVFDANAKTIAETLAKAKEYFLEKCAKIEKSNVYDCSCLSDMYMELPSHKKRIDNPSLLIDQTEFASYRNKIIAEKSEKILQKLDNFCDLSISERKKTENIRKYIGLNSNIPYTQYCKLRKKVKRLKRENGTVRVIDPITSMTILVKNKAITSCIKHDFLNKALSEEKKSCIKKIKSALKKKSHIDGSKYLLGHDTAESLCSCIENNHKDAILSNEANMRFFGNFNTRLDKENKKKCRIE